MTKKLFPATAESNKFIDSPMCARTIKELLPSLDIQSMNTDILQIPTEQNKYHAVAKHTVTFKSGESYSAIGSALPDDKTSSIDALEKAQEFAFQNANKPISEKQLNLIKTRASQKDTDAESLARNKFGKSLARLSGSEAHEMIGLLTDSVY